MSEREHDERVDGRARRYQHRRGEVLDAVIDHVQRHGLSTMTFRTLARGVGVSHVTLMHHFGTKEDLITEIFDVIRRREAIPEQVRDDDIAALIPDLWPQWTSDAGRSQFRLLIEAYALALQEPDRYHGFLDGVVASRIPVIAAIAIQAGCPAEEAEDFATVLLAQLRGLQLDLLATGDDQRVTRALHRFLADLARQRREWNGDSA